MISLLPRHVFLIIFTLLALPSCDDKPHVQVQYPAMETAAFALFAYQCAYCHVPPLPSQYKAKEWPMVMVRMMKHRDERGLPPLSHQEQTEILTYLQHYAAERV